MHKWKPCRTERMKKRSVPMYFGKSFKSHLSNFFFFNFSYQMFDSDTLIVTFNVTDLFSYIPVLGKQTISFWIGKYPNTLHPRFNKRFIIEGIKLILNNNSFQFNKVDYIQTLGTAMGAKMVSTYATLTLVYLEDNLYEIIRWKYDNIKGEFKMIVVYSRNVHGEILTNYTTYSKTYTQNKIHNETQL